MFAFFSILTNSQYANLIGHLRRMRSIYLSEDIHAEDAEAGDGCVPRRRIFTEGMEQVGEVCEVEELRGMQEPMPYR